MDADRLIDELAGLTIIGFWHFHSAAAALLAHSAETTQPKDWHRFVYQRCRKATCNRWAAGGEGHGPSWDASSREDGKLRKQHVGKQTPAWLTHDGPVELTREEENKP